MNSLTQVLLDIARTAQPKKCWICEATYTDPECPLCGPPEPWGPTEADLRDFDKADELDDTERFEEREPEISGQTGFEI